MKTKRLIIENDLYTIRKWILVISPISLVITIVFVFVGWRDFASFSALISVFSLFYLYYLNKKYKSYRVTYYKYLPIHVAEKMLKNSCFELTIDYLIYKNKKEQEIIRWSDFLGYKMIGRFHILILNKKRSRYIISETEMDSSVFKKALRIVKDILPECKTHIHPIS